MESHILCECVCVHCVHLHVHVHVYIYACVYNSECVECGCYSMLATKLNLSEDDAERWIVNLIRNARLDAKIDAKKVSYMYTEY